MFYFSFEELLYSEIAIENNIDNIPPRNERIRVYRNLWALVNNLLDPIQENSSAPMMIETGYRCEELNVLVGGEDDSQHKQGEAVDFYYADFTAEETEQAFFEIAEKFNFDQLIYYKGRGLIHISYSRTKNRHEVFVR